MTTISEDQQNSHDALYAENRHCANMGGNCLNPAEADIDVEMRGRKLTLRLCEPHAHRTVNRGLANATVIAVRAI